MSELMILKLKQVEPLVGLKHSSIYNMIDQGTFPKQVRLGKRSVGWLRHEVEAWIEGRPRVA